MGSADPTLLLNPTTSNDGESVEGCAPLAINNAASPIVTGICTIENNGKTRNIAVRWASSDGAYTATRLDDLAGHDCQVEDENINGDAIGSCADADGDYKAVYWADTGTSAKKLDDNQGYGIAINDAGKVTIDKLTDDGYGRVLTGAPGALTDVGTLTGGYNCSAIGMDQSDDVAINCDNASGFTQAAIYNAATQSVTALLAGASEDIAIARDSLIVAGNEFSAGHIVGFEDTGAVTGSIKRLAMKNNVASRFSAVTSAIRIKPNYSPGYGYGGVSQYTDSNLHQAMWVDEKGKSVVGNDMLLAQMQNCGQCSVYSGIIQGVKYQCNGNAPVVYNSYHPRRS